MKAIIDVDNTLCEYSFVLYEELNKINEEIPLPIDWNHWDFYKGMITEEDFYKAANRAQDRIMECREVPGAREFTENLLKIGFEIVIASHRQDDNKNLLEQWLMNKQIKYNEIHISYDKTVLFDKSVKLVVEDSPVTINESCKRGISTIGVRRPWNRNLKDQNLIMINNYNTMDPIIYEMLKRM